MVRCAPAAFKRSAKPCRTMVPDSASTRANLSDELPQLITSTWDIEAATGRPIPRRRRLFLHSERGSFIVRQEAVLATALPARQAGSVPERTLVVLRYSPWSERARWVLDHHHLSYRTLQHEPFLGERRLRRLSGKRTGRVTVPILLLPGEVLTDSWDIALYADREGASEKLIPAEGQEEIRHLTELADRAMEQNRALFVARLLGSGAALDETLPAWVPFGLRS